MTPQEIFDTAARGIIQQGGPSMDVNECRYRGPNGRKCAAGWLISDDDYDPRMEGKLFGRENFRRWPDYAPEHMKLICHLQYAHDNAADGGDFFEQWRLNMHEVARAYDLNADVLDA